MKLTRFIIFLIIFSLILSTIALASEYFTIHNNTEIKRLSEGVTYEHIEKLSSVGWININVIRADLTNKHTEIEPIFNNSGISNRSELSEMLKDSKAIAGINGDFFYMSNNSFPMGTLIKDDQIISSPNIPAYEFPTITQMENGDIDISIWEPNIYLETENNVIFPVAAINKTGAFKGEVILLNNSWGKKSIGSSKDRELIEIVVSKNKIRSIRVNKSSTYIPSNGYVIVCSASRKNELLSAFKVGSKVNLKYEFDFNIEDIDWSAGGVNYLVKNGELYKTNSSINGRHPRTAIGYNKEKTEMLLVTIDGRNKDYTGITQEELSTIMLELGAYNAVNMDGGGSTSMGIDLMRNGDVEIVNYPSDGQERRIDSGLAVFNTSPMSNTIKYLEILPSQTTAFKNTTISFEIKAYNKYFNEISNKSNRIKLKAIGLNGKMSGKNFTPYSSGTVKIQASYGNIKETIDIEVLDTPVDIIFDKDTLVLDKNETYDIGEIIGVDQDGNSAIIPSDNINWSYRNRVGKIKDGVLVAGSSSNTGVITAKFGEAIENIYVKVGYKAITIENFDKTDNLIFSVYPSNSEGHVEKSSKKKEGSSSLKLNYDFTKMTDQSIAFVNFGTDGIELDGEPEAIGMWVYGDGKNHWLRCRITDNTGTLYKIDFAKEVNWKGWKWVTAKIPESAQYPIKLKNVYIAEIYESMKDSGSIYLDNLRALYEPDDKDINVLDETYFKDPLLIEDIEIYEYKLKIENGILQRDTFNKEITNDDFSDSEVLFIDISKGGINSTNTEQWKLIKNLESLENKNIVISLNRSINMFNDKKELEVFEEILGNVSLENNVFVVWSGSNNYFSIKNKVRYIEFINSFELYITVDGVFYKK